MQSNMKKKLVPIAGTPINMLNLPAGCAAAATNARERVFSWTLRRLPRVPDEPSQPPAALWRPCVSASLVDWGAFGGARRAVY